MVYSENDVQAAMSGFIAKRIVDRFSTVLRRVQESGRPDRVLLVISRSHSLHVAARIAAVEARWHVIHARSLEHALETLSTERVWVVLYDANLRYLSWTTALHLVQACAQSAPAFLLLAAQGDACDWEELIERGGFDVLPARSPMARVAAAVNAAMSLAASADAVAETAESAMGGR